MDSPFQQYLGTNYVPAVDEAKKIQDLVEISGQKLRCIDTEIDQLQRQLACFRQNGREYMTLLNSIELYYRLLGSLLRISSKRYS
ncbi:hypothetical protein BDQ17DRAFT_281405 [Cyathus striatus]|nr:hypothetical protein BDQ17DRAFT_281405 [Cyathus striatus]